MAIVVRPGMSVGAMAAEDDGKFLTECFLETGTVSQISDIENPKCIALGRTGSGKSAILLHLLQNADNISQIEPDALSLNYISNSTILRFFNELDINLDVFYQLLWRHVIVVELLKLKKQFHDQDSANRWIANIQNKISPNKKRIAAIEYLTKFGSSFWLDTEKRVREVVDKIEQSLEQSLGISVDALRVKILADVKDGDSKSVTETSEIISRAQKVVNDVQIQELNEIINFLSEDVFNDKLAKYYLVVDDLDTGWVHDNLRFKLIRALIETIKKFRKIPNLKIIISMRADLLESVLKNTHEKGFQTEKFEDLMIKVKWSRSDLKSMISKRLNTIFKDQYTSKEIEFDEVFPTKIGEVDSLNYMLDRSLQRPRDVISFVNECFTASDGGTTSIGTKVIRNAEASYSRKRVAALADEWREAYGSLEVALESLGGLEVRFTFADLRDEFFEDLCLRVIVGDGVSIGQFANFCNAAINGPTANYNVVRRAFIEIMYIIGAIGIKKSPGSAFEWSYNSDPTLNFSVVEPTTKFAIHPMLHRHFNIKSDGSGFNT